MRALPRCRPAAFAACTLWLAASAPTPCDSAPASCKPSNATCWPSTDAWNALDGAFEGSIHLGSNFSYSQCASAGDDAFKLEDGFGGFCMQYSNCANAFCAASGTTNLAPVSVEVKSVADVQAALKFATKHNIEVAVKTTGHSYSGSSTNPNAMLIWMRHFPKRSSAGVEETWADSCGTTYKNTIAVGGGEVWGEVYVGVGSKFDIVGGGAASVSAAGGWLQGGGLSSISRKYGLGIDNVVVFEGVTADGSVFTADACTNSDLFFALRGGGGGTYGVVTGVRYKTHKAEGITALNLHISDKQGRAPRRVWDSYLAWWIATAPTLDDRWAGYFKLQADALMLHCVGTASTPGCEVLNISLQQWKASLAPPDREYVNIDYKTVADSYFNMRGGLAGFAATVDKTGNPETGIKSRVIPQKWLEESPSEVHAILMAAVAGGGECKDAEKPLGGLGLPANVGGVNCQTYASFYNAGSAGANEKCDEASIRGHSACDPGCQASPGFLAYKCPVTCGRCAAAATGADAGSALITPATPTFNYFLGGAMNKVPIDGTGINPAFRRCVWQIEAFGPSGQVLMDALKNSGASQLRGGGAGYNHGARDEPDWASAFWGANLPTLQGIKLEHDPLGRFNAWHTVGYVGPDPDAAYFEFASAISTPTDQRIAITRGNAGGVSPPQYVTAAGNFDWKPQFTPGAARGGGGHITFFRCAADQKPKGGGCYADKTAIMVVDVAGTNVKPITAFLKGTANWNPTWTRDGSDRVLFTRHVDATGEFGGYITCATGVAGCTPGQEKKLMPAAIRQQIQATGAYAMEWAHAGFADGRIMTVRILAAHGATRDKYRTELHALTLSDDTGDYEQNTYAQFKFGANIDWGPGNYVHKVHLSPSERYVAYQKNGDEGEDHSKSQLFWCKIDVKTMTLSDEVAFTEKDAPGNQWYPRFTKDERHITYSSQEDGTFRVYAYAVAQKTTAKVTQRGENHWYPAPLGTNMPWNALQITVYGQAPAPPRKRLPENASLETRVPAPTAPTTAAPVGKDNAGRAGTSGRDGSAADAGSVAAGGIATTAFGGDGGGGDAAGVATTPPPAENSAACVVGPTVQSVVAVLAGVAVAAALT